MLRLRQDEHFVFNVTTTPGDYLNPTISLNLLPPIKKWLDDHEAEWTIHQVTNREYSTCYLIFEVDLEISDPDLAMLFKLTWL